MPSFPQSGAERSARLSSGQGHIGSSRPVGRGFPMCLTCGCKMPNDRHKPGDIIWEDIEKAGKNWDLTPTEALDNLTEAAKLVKK